MLNQDKAGRLEPETDPEYLARLIHSAMADSEVVGDPDFILNRIKTLDSGISIEDQFAYLCRWSGKVKLIHRLDQNQYPRESILEYRVPDFFVIFDTPKGPLPVFVEVKSSKRPFLKWKTAYFEAMRRYADTHKLPLLVAWHEPLKGIWALFDSNHFKDNETSFRIERKDAWAQTLSGLLLGDLFLSFDPAFRLHSIYPTVIPPGKKPKTGGIFGFKDGRVFEQIDGGLLATFLSLIPTQTIKEIRDMTLATYTLETVTTSLHRTAIIMAMYFNDGSTNVKWRKVLRKGLLHRTSNDFMKSVEKAAKLGIVQNVTKIDPLEIPPYLSN